MAETFEWGVEITTTTESDQHEAGEVLDTLHVASFREALRTAEGELTAHTKGVVVLIRDDSYERLWAYLRDDCKLPEMFEDAFQREIVRVPKRFHAEVATYLYNEMPGRTGDSARDHWGSYEAVANRIAEQGSQA